MALKAQRQFQQLLADVEELLERLDDEHSPQLDEMRAQVEATISEVKAALQRRSKGPGHRTAFVCGALLGAALGILIASLRSDD